MVSTLFNYRWRHMDLKFLSWFVNPGFWVTDSIKLKENFVVSWAKIYHESCTWHLIPILMYWIELVDYRVFFLLYLGYSDLKSILRMTFHNMWLLLVGSSSILFFLVLCSTTIFFHAFGVHYAVTNSVFSHFHKLWHIYDMM